MPSLIEDYAMIGDCHTAALVGRDGSMDWLCFPRFDSGACFAAILGGEENGRWLITPANEIKSTRRRYRQGSLVLETDYETEEGAVTLIDCMRRAARNRTWFDWSWAARSGSDADAAHHPLRLRFDRSVGSSHRKRPSRRGRAGYSRAANERRASRRGFHNRG
jgi:GH15 family glucan-1,4-alpha-glucosidase